MKQKPTAEDWVILRLLRAWILSSPFSKRDPSVVKSVLFLTDKLGKKTINNMVTQLKKEQE